MKIGAAVVLDAIESLEGWEVGLGRRGKEMVWENPKCAISERFGGEVER